MIHNKLIYSLVTVLMVLLLSISSPVYSEEEESRSVMPMDGELILPDDYKKTGDGKCVTVCNRWGESCILMNKGGTSARVPGGGVTVGGGYERKCRRVCESFGEECF